MKPKNILKKTKALFFDSNSLIFSKGHKVFRREANGNSKWLFSFDESLLNKLLNKIPLIYRLMRSGVGASINQAGYYYFSYDRKLFSFDYSKKLLVEEMVFDRGRGPLQFCVSEGIEGFSDGIYFGEYFGNHDRNPVSIYGKSNDGKWSIAYTFGTGEINHIHALIPDKERNCVWILVGDFSHSAGIWMAKDNFKTVTPIVTGEQTYRACVAFPVKNGLIYATDTQLEKNSVQLLSFNDGLWETNHLYGINGSCIYGCELADYYVFSTSTEPSDKPTNKLFGLLDNKPGPGILKNSSDIVLCKKDGYSFSILSTKNKDFFPYRLFQFGTIMFPSGKNNSNVLYAYNIGNKGNDLCTEIFEI